MKKDRQGRGVHGGGETGAKGKLSKEQHQKKKDRKVIDYFDMKIPKIAA